MKIYIDLKKAVAQGITRDKASYAARVKIGVEADGSPLYRYFKTKEDYDKYLAKKKKESSSKEEDSKDTLKNTVEKEHEDSVRKIKSTAYETKKKHDKESTKKSLRIYVDE